MSLPRNRTVLITGAAGWLGGLVADALARASDEQYDLILTDIVEPKSPASSSSTRIKTLKADLNDKSQIELLFQSELGCPDVVYCMHGIMSRGSEDNFDLGVKVNIDSVRSLLDVVRDQGARRGAVLKFIFTSSLAVYGGPLPDIITPSTPATPEGAYGMAKLVCELFINEYTRRGFVDGRIARLPTIVVRPGIPSGATSAFISGIIRGPLMGLKTTCPIGTSLSSPELSLPLWVASAETTVRNLIIASHVPASSFTSHTRVVCLPGITSTVREELQALEKVGGKEALEKIVFEDDEISRRVVSSWPARFDISYALSLGFKIDKGGIISIVEGFSRSIGMREQ